MFGSRLLPGLQLPRRQGAESAVEHGPRWPQPSARHQEPAPAPDIFMPLQKIRLWIIGIFILCLSTRPVMSHFSVRF